MQEEILIIEDEPVVANLLKEMFEKFEPKRKARIVERISDAQEVLRLNPTRYKLITLDLQLDDSRSLQGLKLLADEFPLIPKGIITATISHELQMEAEDEGAIFYITKPFADTRIAYSIINRAMNIWWVQYGICRKAWEAEQHKKLTAQMREESPTESPLLKKWQFWAATFAAIATAATTIGAFGKSAGHFIAEVWQKIVK
jgi:DNA-binding NtrC family response regulator